MHTSDIQTVRERILTKVLMLVPSLLLQADVYLTMTEFSILGEVKRGASKTTTMDFRRADVDLFRMLVERLPGDKVLKGKGVQEGWTFFKEEVIKAQEQAVPMCRKTHQRGR